MQTINVSSKLIGDFKTRYNTIKFTFKISTECDYFSGSLRFYSYFGQVHARPLLEENILMTSSFPNLRYKGRLCTLRFSSDNFNKPSTEARVSRVTFPQHVWRYVGSTIL